MMIKIPPSPHGMLYNILFWIGLEYYSTNIHLSFPDAFTTTLSYIYHANKILKSRVEKSS